MRPAIGVTSTFVDFDPIMTLEKSCPIWPDLFCVIHHAQQSPLAFNDEGLTPGFLLDGCLAMNLVRWKASAVGF